jgi:ATP-dependent Clp protease ATP-binding subunit ClpA
MPTFSPELEATLHRALDLANKRMVEYATLEHLLFALSTDPDATRVLLACGCDIAAMQDELRPHLEPSPSNPGTTGKFSKPVTAFQRVIQRAVIQVQSRDLEEVTGAYLVVTIFAERESYAAYFLEQQGVTRRDAADFLAFGTRRNSQIR